MEIGLKSFLPIIAEHVGLSAAALYEHQRALTGIGVLKMRPGKGPGSGVSLSAENIAALLLSVLFTENPSMVDRRVKALCRATPLEPCKFTNAKTLRAAVAAMVNMTGPELRPFHSLLLFRDQLEASIKFQVSASGDVATTYFEAGENLNRPAPISTIREMMHATIEDVASSYRERGI